MFSRRRLALIRAAHEAHRLRSVSKTVLMPVGILLLLGFAGSVGYKFHNVFYTPEEANPVAVADNPQVEAIEAEDSLESIWHDLDIETVPVNKPKAKPNTAPVAKPDKPNCPAGSSKKTAIPVVNKCRPLNPKTYVPTGLRKPSVKHKNKSHESANLTNNAATAAEKLFAAAKAAGHDPMFASGYRSYNYQVTVYNGYVASYGQAKADTFSARPGYSEHQTGLVFDICEASNCQLEEWFGNTSLGKWVAAHAHEYGFIVRYPKGKTSITGYTYEPWHLRYVGKSIAAEIKSSGKTLEEYYKLPAAPDYN